MRCDFHRISFTQLDDILGRDSEREKVNNDARISFGRSLTTRAVPNFAKISNEKLVKNCLIYPKVNKQTRVQPQITSAMIQPEVKCGFLHLPHTHTHSHIAMSAGRSFDAFSRKSWIWYDGVEICSPNRSVRHRFASHRLASHRIQSKGRSLIGFVNNISDVYDSFVWRAGVGAVQCNNMNKNAHVKWYLFGHISHLCAAIICQCFHPSIHAFDIRIGFFPAIYN